jgi:hypothetical protein
MTYNLSEINEIIVRLNNFTDKMVNSNISHLEFQNTVKNVETKFSNKK